MPADWDNAKIKMANFNSRALNALFSDNSGTSRVVTLKSPVGFLPCKFSPFINLGDLFVLPHVCMLI